MKKLMVVVLVTVSTTGALAYGWGCRPCGPGWGHCPPPCRPGGWWGRGGCNFWPGFIGGVVGGMAYNAVARPYCSETVVVRQPVVPSPVIVQHPTVVTQPVVVQQQPVVVQQPVVQQPVVAQPAQVWVEGRYVDQVQANGTVVRVWQAGHYE